MYRRTTKWRPARYGGSGAIAVEKVESDTEVGLAKQRSAVNEKLASDLAQYSGVKVPKVELDTVEGQNGLYAISHAHGKESIDVLLLRERLGDRFKSPEVQDALKRSSGLLAFYAWIAAQDLKDDHLVLATKPNGEYDVAGVDFESSFQWAGSDGGQVQSPGIPQAMRPNIDKGAIAAVVSKIEAITDEQIRNAVNSLPDSMAKPDEKRRLSEGLIERRGKVRVTMKIQGWMD